jgi:hypothetical protein
MFSLWLNEQDKQLFATVAANMKDAVAIIQRALDPNPDVRVVSLRPALIDFNHLSSGSDRMQANFAVIWSVEGRTPKRKHPLVC